MVYGFFEMSSTVRFHYRVPDLMSPSLTSFCAISICELLFVYYGHKLNFFYSTILQQSLNTP
jgi:hypothetical protein